MLDRCLVLRFSYNIMTFTNQLLTLMNMPHRWTDYAKVLHGLYLLCSALQWLYLFPLNSVKTVCRLQFYIKAIFFGLSISFGKESTE